MFSARFSIELIQKQCMDNGLLCRELDLKAKFKELEASSYAELTTAIKTETTLPASIFNLFLNKIYKRSR